MAPWTPSSLVSLLSHCRLKWGPAACYSRGIERPSWWEGKFVLLWMLATGGGMWTPVQRLTPLPWQSVLKSFYRQREGASIRNGTASSNSHIEVSHWWSDQYHVDYFHFSSFQLLSGVLLFATLWTAAHQASLSITNSQSLPKLMSIESLMPSSVIPFSSCLQSFPASGSFQMSQLFSSGGQSIRVSALASFLPKKSQGWSPSEWTGWISL